jgi:hypothetical protein
VIDKNGKVHICDMRKKKRERKLTDLLLFSRTERKGQYKDFLFVYREQKGITRSSVVF